MNKPGSASVTNTKWTRETKPSWQILQNKEEGNWESHVYCIVGRYLSGDCQSKLIIIEKEK